MTIRQSFARLRSWALFGQQRKLFLLVFLWTCLCLVIFKSTLFNSGATQDQQQVNEQASSRLLRARSPASTAGPKSQSIGPPLYLSQPEFALPDNINSQALYYSLSSISASSASSSPTATKQSTHSSVEQPSVLLHPTNDASPPQSAPHRQVARLSRPPEDSQQLQQQQQQQHVKQKPNANEQQIVAGSQCKYDYPSLFDLQFNNIHWQKMTTSSDTAGNSSTSATYYLYNAYYDDRWRGGLPSVRILAMIDRIQPPPTNCLLWSNKLHVKHQTTSSSSGNSDDKLKPLITRASFVYAWYPKWGNYKDGLLQPWIVTCPMPRAHVGLVPDSVSLVEVPPKLPDQESTTSADFDTDEESLFLAASGSQRSKRQASGIELASIAMPPSFSSSSPAAAQHQVAQSQQQQQQQQVLTSPQNSASSVPPGSKSPISARYDCKRTLPITNNLPVFNQRPTVKEKFAVCVKGLDFPHEDVSVRLVEWIELLNLLGAGKIFLYNLDVHENISKVLHYYEKRGIVELSPLTLPGDQPNLPEYQHLYLKSKLTAKRQNELIPYNDCLYRNLNSYQYLALLDIDEIIMPLGNQHTWHDLMQQVESLSLAEQNYSRASYNVRNVYFFDDLAGPLGTTSSSTTTTSQAASLADAADSADNETAPDQSKDSDDNNQSDGQSLERGIPHYLHMMQHVYRSKNYTKPGQYVKCFHNTERVVSLHNHFPMNCFGQCTTYSVPVHMAHLQHYRKDCVGPLKQSCKNDFRVFTTRDTTIWKYKQQMIKRTTRVLNHLGLLTSKPQPTPENASNQRQNSGRQTSPTT